VCATENSDDVVWLCERGVAVEVTAAAEAAAEAEAEAEHEEERRQTHAEALSPCAGALTAEERAFVKMLNEELGRFNEFYIEKVRATTPRRAQAGGV
jgi:hypothetical protein